MPSFALPNAALLDILTLSDGGDPPPSWAREWAESVAVYAHVDVGPRRAARRNVWATRLDEAVRRAERPVVIVAYGVSCFALAWWARLSPTPYFERIAGALLVRPLGPGVSASSQGARDYVGPRMPLPFRSIVVGDGERDRRAATVARAWGSEFVGFDGFARDDDGLGDRALQIGTGLMERLAGAAPAAPPAKPSLGPANQESDCLAAAL